jgi:selenide,water dikinase
VDDPYLFGQIAATNAISDVYAMGGEPRLALNVLCVTESMEEGWVREILRGGYDKAYEAGVIISGGHTIHGSEPLYGLAVTGFAKPEQIRKNDAAKPGDVLILTKKLGVGILTTAAKAEMMTDPAVMERLYRQMTQLNKTACEVMQRFRVHSCTDVTGFGLMGHSCEMAQGSGTTLHLQTAAIPFHQEALEYADMGLVPAGAYRNRDFCEKAAEVRGDVSRAMQDILFDPQTSGGLLIAVDERDGEALLREMKSVIPDAAMIGYVTEREEKAIVIEA